MVKRKIYSSTHINRHNRSVIRVDDLDKIVTIQAVSEIDFVTLGVKLRGELFLRASKVLSDFDILKEETHQRKNSTLATVFKLVQGYARSHEFYFRPERFPADNWLNNRYVRLSMDYGFLQGLLRESLKVKNKISLLADKSEIYAVAFGIIQEYEIFCSHIVAIKNHVKTERKKLDIYRKAFLLILENRDGLICKVCPSTENLQIDHITPLSLGGLTVIENLQFLCASHNGSKGNRPMSYLFYRMSKISA